MQSHCIKEKRKLLNTVLLLNKHLLKLSLISWAELASWRESPGSSDGFIVLLCGRRKAQEGSQSPFFCSSAFELQLVAQ